jgi:3-hydroxybutyryl-CoA dehydrogenase
LSCGKTGKKLLAAPKNALKKREAKSNPKPRSLDRNRARSVAGVVGMGLMGTSISACLLAAGHRLAGVEADPAKLWTARKRLLELLEDAEREGLLSAPASTLIERATISANFSVLKGATFVVESTVEDPAIKRQVIANVERFVSPETLIGSNTSAIPVTDLQRDCRHPERVLGLHWAEPAHLTRFMEIVCGKKTSIANARRAMRLASTWGKEPSLLRRDIRGFITNRIMYAMLREAFYLVESGYATVADVDRSMRNDLGYWITFAGPFRFMDLTGIPVYAAVMKDLWPELSCRKEMPRLMQRVVKSGARGVSNANGFYRYTPKQAKEWEERFLEFSYRIRDFAGDFAENPRKRPQRSSRNRATVGR